MYNFTYSTIGLKMWKAYSVGEGKLITWSSLGRAAKTMELKTGVNWGHTETHPDENNNQDKVKETSPKQTVFECPVDNCAKKFSTQRSVDNHILMGNCLFDANERFSIAERAKYIYADKILDMYPSGHRTTQSTSPNSCTEIANHSVPIGWALKETKGRVTFTKEQKEFMVDKFNIGKITGNKVDPYVAAEEMRMSGKFTRTEYLSGQQITSFFSRLYQQEKMNSPDDYNAAVCEDSKDKLRTTIQNILS